MRVGLFCELSVKPEYIDDFLPLMEQHSTSCPQIEEGCVLFRVGRDRDHPNLIRIYEEYLNWDERVRHASTERYDAFNAKIDHMLSNVIVYEVDLPWGER